MPLEYEQRTFIGNLNPPPNTDGMSDFRPPRSASAGGIPSTDELPHAVDASNPVVAKTKGIHRVVDTPDGRRRMFYQSPDGETVDKGGILATTEALNSVGEYDEKGKMWTVPEKYAQSFERGKPGFTEHVANSFHGAEAGMHLGLTGYLALTKKMSYTDAIANTDTDLVKAQLTDFPKSAWGDNRLQKIVGASKWALGALAEIIPSQMGNLKAGAEVAPTVGLVATAVAATGGPAGLAALATPPAIITLAGISWRYGAFDFTAKQTSGALALDMKRKGIDEKTIEMVAPMAGMFAGSLEIVGAKYMAAPFKRLVVGKMLNNAAIKKAMTHWAVNYFKEVGAEVSVEVAQQYVENFGTNIMASMDSRPDVHKNWDTMNIEAAKVALKTAVGMGLLKAPGMAFEASMSKPDGVFKAETGDGKPTVKPAAADAPVAPVETPKAPALEQQMVAEDPEVAQAMAELNGELDPTAPDASINYQEIGKELVGDENATAAVTAKIEALRMEQSDLLAEEGANTPFEQKRIADIGNEISLLGEMKNQMDGAREFGEEFTSGDQTVTVDALGMPLSEKKPITGAKKRVEAAVTKARDTKLVSEMTSTLAVVKELEIARDRLAKAEKPTRLLDAKIASLMERVYKIDEERNALSAGEKGTEGGKLEMTPATLESIKKAAFTEGRKEVIVRRAEMINQVAENHSLTDHDIKSMTKNRNLGVMSDMDFKKYIDDLRVKAAELSKRKQALRELQATRDEKSLVKEQNLRKIHDLPPVAKMTTEQIKQYTDLLEQYEVGEEFWTPKRFEALKATRWAGAESVQDVIEKAAKEFGLTPEDLKSIKVSEFDRFRYDTALARRNALYNFMVDEVKLAEVKHTATYFEVREKLYALAAEAQKGKGMGDWLAPQQAAVMAYLESEGEAKTAAAAALTPAELKLAEYIEKVYADSLEYLTAGKDLESTRFAGKYVMHARKPLSEILAGVKEAGVKETWTEIKKLWQMDEMNFRATDEKGQQLGLRKFFRQTMFRSGEMSPSKNVVRSTDIYLRQFFKKKALDEAVPSVETLTMALAAADKTDDGKAAGKVLENFVRTYLNAKKGQSAITGVVQGGKIDASIRFVTNLVSLNMIALNIPLQVASVTGETIAKIPALGIPGLAKAQYRKLTKQGRVIAKKYKSFTGEGVIEELRQPGKTIEERAGVLVYGLFKWSRANTMRDLILGNMTDAEFKAGVMAPERLAEIKKTAGRWLDLGEAKSIIGSTSLGKMGTQYKSWAVPILSSSIDIASGLVKAATGTGKLTAQQTAEIYRLTEATALVLLVQGLAGEADKDDDSMMGRTKFYIMRELTTLMQGADVLRMATVPVAMKWVERLANNLKMLLALEKTKTTGELTGWKGLKKQLTPAMVKQLDSSPKKSEPPRPIKFNRPEGRQ